MCVVAPAHANLQDGHRRRDRETLLQALRAQDQPPPSTLEEPRVARREDGTTEKVFDQGHETGELTVNAAPRWQQALVRQRLRTWTTMLLRQLRELYFWRNLRIHQ